MLERIMIVSGESSGELYGSFLALALKERNPGIEIRGVGGDRMHAAGVELISGIAGAFGITEAVRTYGKIKKTYAAVVAALQSFRPQVLVLIDYPDFNLKVARVAKRAGIKILYYVSPQIWAWRKKRIKIIGELVDQMAVILPFEKEIYTGAGIPCEFVGHPVMDEIREVVHAAGFGMQDIGSEGLRTKARKDLGLIPDRPVLALMPGSRPHEIERLLPVMTEAIAEIHEAYPDYQLVLPVAPNLDDSLFASHHVLKKCRLVKGQSIKALLAADSAVIASGTSTLQAALLGVPMSVIYKLSPLTYFIGKLIVKVKHISLVNILLDKSVADGAAGLRVKEFLQGDANRENIMAEFRRITEDAGYRSEMISQLGKTGKLFQDRSASMRVAEAVEILGEG